MLTSIYKSSTIATHKAMAWYTSLSTNMATTLQWEA